MSKPEHVSVVLTRIMARIQEGARERQEGVQDAGRYVGFGEERKCSREQSRCRGVDSCCGAESEDAGRGLKSV